MHSINSLSRRPDLEEGVIAGTCVNKPVNFSQKIRKPKISQGAPIIYEKLETEVYPICNIRTEKSFCAVRLEIMSNYCNEHHSSYEKGSHYNNDYIRPNPQLQSQAK